MRHSAGIATGVRTQGATSAADMARETTSSVQAVHASWQRSHSDKRVWCLARARARARARVTTYFVEGR